MTMEYLKICFPEARAVKIDGDSFGPDTTNVVLEVEAGTHVVSLEPPPDFTPLSHVVVLADTTQFSPREVTFGKVASASPD